MALGTITKPTGKKSGANAGKVVHLTVSFAGDSAYPTGGTAGFTALVNAVSPKEAFTVIGVLNADAGGYMPVYDDVNDKLKVYRVGAINSPMAEVPNATDLSAVTFRLVLVVK